MFLRWCNSSFFKHMDQGRCQEPPANTGMDCRLGKVMGDSAKGGKERKGRRVCKNKDEVSQDNVFLNNRDVLITVHYVWFLAQSLKISQLDIGTCSWHCKMIGQRSKKKIISQLRFWNKNSNYSKRKQANSVLQKKVLYIPNSRSQSRCLGENKGPQFRRHLSTVVVEYLDPQINIIVSPDLEECFFSSKCRKGVGGTNQISTE